MVSCVLPGVSPDHNQLCTIPKAKTRKTSNLKRNFEHDWILKIELATKKLKYSRLLEEGEVGSTFQPTSWKQTFLLLPLKRNTSKILPYSLYSIKESVKEQRELQ